MTNYRYVARDSLPSSPKLFSFPQYGTEIVFKLLAGSLQGNRRNAYKGRPGLIPGASTLRAKRWNYAKEGNVFANEHSAMVKCKVFNSFVNIAKVKN